MRLDEFSAGPSGSGLAATEITRWLCLGFDITAIVLGTLSTIDTAITSLTPLRTVSSLTPERLLESLTSLRRIAQV